MTFAKESLPFVAPLGIAALVLLLFGQLPTALFLAGLAVLVLLFFRIPKRQTEAAEGMILAPANGRILRIDRSPALLNREGDVQRIVTFLSVFNVHVQRAPVSGEVVESRFTPGRKIAAFKAEADSVNENHLTVLRRENGDLIGIRQVAGLVARRVVCRLLPGDLIQRGDLMGLIKFGSRVDLMLPDQYEILVRQGDRLREGDTVVAKPRTQ
ncbi:MAG: phosphatidylserine decarboxylase [Thermoanaerobaculia bacterium]|jgi:phosphatidylserine decarboxylase